MLASVGYTMREIKPAKNYDVVSMAKAMNDDFAPKMKELFDTETDAAVEAIRTGKPTSLTVYITAFCVELGIFVTKMSFSLWKLDYVYS